MKLNTKLCETTLGLLKCVSDKFQSFAGWTTGVEARDSEGMEVPYDSDDAVAYCVLGAVYRCVHEAGFNRGSSECQLALRFMQVGMYDAEDRYFTWGIGDDASESAIPGLNDSQSSETKFKELIRPAVAYAIGAAQGLVDHARTVEAEEAKAEPETVSV